MLKIYVLTFTAVISSFVSLPTTVCASDIESEAKAAFRRAVAAFGAEDYETALREFESSYSLKPKTSILFNIGMCLKAMARWSEAKKNFEQYLNNADSEQLKPERAEAARVALDDLNELVWMMYLRDLPADALVSINGSRFPVPGPEEPLYLDPGPIMLEIAKPGYDTFRKSLQSQSGVTVEVRVKLKESAPDEAEPPLSLVTSENSPHAEPQESTFALATTGITTGAAGLIAAGLGGYFLYVRNTSDYEDVAKYKNGDEDKYDQAVDRAKAHETVAVVSLVTAGVFVSVAVTSLIVANRKKKKSDVPNIAVLPGSISVEF